MRQAGHVERMGKMKGAYKKSACKPDGKSPFDRSRRICQDNSKMDIAETARKIVTQFNTAEYRVQCWAFVNAVMNP